MTNSFIVPVILCGGSGSRLWPLSRESYPKQFLSIKKEEKFSLLQQTIKRISTLKNVKKPILVVPCPLCPILHITLSEVSTGDAIFCPQSDDALLCSAGDQLSGDHNTAEPL